MPDLEIYNSQTNQNNIGYENCVQNRDEQKFSKLKSYNLFRKINWGINTIDFPTHRTKVLRKEISRNHLNSMKNTLSSWWFFSAAQMANTKIFPFLLLLSPLSLSSYSFPFLFLTSYDP